MQSSNVFYSAGSGRKGIPIEKMLPISKLEHDAILSMQGDITFAYQAILPEIFSLSDKEYEEFHQILIKAIKVLPKHSIFHKQDFFSERSFQPKDQGRKSFLNQSSDRFFLGRKYLDHSCTIMLTKQPAGRRLSSSSFSNILRSSIVPRQGIDQILLDDFSDKAGQFCRILTDSGFVQLRRLGNDELSGSKEKAGILEKYCFLQGQDGLPVLQDIHLNQEIRVGDKNCLLYTLADAEDLPGFCGSRVNYDKYSTDKTRFSTGFASSIGLLLPCNHIMNQYIFIQDAAKTMKTLESKRLRLQSLSAYSRENSIARDATHDFLNEAISGQRLPVKAHVNLLVWTEDKASLPELKTLVSSALVQMDASPKLETDGAAQIFWSGLPGNEADFPMNDTFDTFLEQATCFLNLESGYRSSKSPSAFRLGERLNGRPVQVDISDEPVKLGLISNRNKFILGPSGSGKSFFTNHMVRSYYEMGTHIVLVDVGHSYKGLCDLVGGYYFTYEEKKPICFNPFFLSEGDVLDTEKKESIKTLLLALWKKDDELYSRSEYVAVSDAVTLFFEFLALNPDVFPCFNSFYAFVRDGYSARLLERQVKEKEFDLANFLYVLNPYFQGGEFDYLLNSRENLNLLKERFIVFELDNVKDHPVLFPVVTLIIMEVFISKMRKLKGVRKMILIEEAWKAIAKEGMAQYIKYLFKTVRKFFGEAIVVTQEVEDIISSPIVKQAIINNSDCKILLDQSKYQNKFEQIQELLGLTEKEKAQILSINKANDPRLNYREVFISLGGQKSKVFRTEVSTEEYFAYTTEETEKIKVMRYALEQGSMEKGIARLAAEIRKEKAGLAG
ncbi:Conjugative transposon protein TraG [Arcticibacter svalbardensis MN12-7]|uniref:Conjugative transposon protein TraG n=1 Tax=Arcticibacter svalbardensis MN12-7 TaxID=1150600 RepID=R9GWT3_9SPHI|nr:TraG family conjugative transposon ATPase [Arcticibacter svalbardensis]EOR96267.1 Conjugative transposon protein TraG [Arcticibacter svalbardensis MN12-7]